MSWNEVKYAVNSTLGTSLFKPLDKILCDKLDQLLSSSYGEKLIIITGIFVVPDAITTIYISACAAGGLGLTENSGYGISGSAGEYIMQEAVNVIPGQIFNITVGMGNTIIESPAFSKTLIANSIKKEVKNNVLGFFTGKNGYGAANNGVGGYGGAYGFGGGVGGNASNYTDGSTGGGNGGTYLDGYTNGYTGNDASKFYGASGENGGRSTGGSGGDAGGYGAGGGAGNRGGLGGTGSSGMVFFQWGALPR